MACVYECPACQFIVNELCYDSFIVKPNCRCGKPMSEFKPVRRFGPKTGRVLELPQNPSKERSRMPVVPFLGESEGSGRVGGSGGACGSYRIDNETGT